MGVPVSARPLAETGTLGLQLVAPSLWPIRVFTRRNRYGATRAARRRAPKPHGLVQVSAMKVLPPLHFQRRTCNASPDTARQARRRNRYARNSGEWNEAGTRFLANGERKRQRGIKNAHSVADLGTHACLRTALIHAETGTLLPLPSRSSRKSRAIARRNGYASAKKHQAASRHTCFLWITLWITRCCSRRFRYAPCAEAGTVSRRSGYAPTQNLVRDYAESGSVYPSKRSAGKALRGAYTVYL